MDVAEKVSLAFKHYQEGNLAQAERDCLEILAVQPENAEILHLLGLTCHFQGRHDEAVGHLMKALVSDADNADILYDLGNVYHEQGRLEEAVTAYRKAITIEPEHVDALCNLGMICHDTGRVGEAISYYERALELAPNNALIHNNIALAYQDNEELQKAVAHYGKALQLEPNYADVYYNMGHVFMSEGQTNQAFMYFRKAAELNPGLADAYLSMAHILAEGGRFQDAIPILREVLRHHPDSAEIHNRLGYALNEIWETDEAIDRLRTAVELRPDFAEAHNNLGNALSRMGRFSEGLQHIEKALELNPRMVEAHINLGTVHKDRGQFTKAAECYSRALEIDPENAEARFNQAILDLTAGNYDAGWEGYEWRRHVKFARERAFSHPDWNGESLRGKTLFVYAEQGLGDEIMFSSCLPEVIAQAGCVVVEAEPRLVQLFERSFAGATVVPRLAGDRYPKELPQPDYQIASGSLPKFLRRGLADFPVRDSYLVPDTEKVEEWRSRYSELGAGLKVGISWYGGSTPDVIRVRSINLERFGGLFSISGLHFVNLQYGDCRDDLRVVEEKFGAKIHDWEDADPLKDLDAFAGKIAALDLVVSVDNSTVHLSGALGVPVWVLLPYVCEWRWMLEYEDSPWYERARLFRQGKEGDWERVFDRVIPLLKESADAGKVTDVNVKCSFRDGRATAW